VSFGRISLLSLLICSFGCTTHGEAGPSVSKVKFEKIFEVKDVIWGFDFLPDGKIIFTEREGRMSLFDPQTKKTQLLKNVPKVHTAGQAGLLDVRVHPEFAKNSLIYFTYAEPIGKDKSTTALGMARLSGSELMDVKKKFSAHEPNDNDIHYGSRIEFHDNHLFFTIGDRNERPQVQNLSFHIGKVIRLKMDGSVPSDNPFVGDKNAKPEVWALGIRSPQGLTINPATNELWESEMGPRGGDEINLVKPGKNYGWPDVTFGREYHGPSIGPSTKPGIEEPLTYWVPSISPSAIAFYTGDKIPAWKNNLFIATLSGRHIRRVVWEGKKVAQQEELLKDLGLRWRSIRMGKDGDLYLGTDEGQFGRLISK
jgi:aldose sugar dehydrogenase